MNRQIELVCFVIKVAIFQSIFELVVYFLLEDEWEKELQAELQDYELASEGSGHTAGIDGDDIEEMLDAEDDLKQSKKVNLPQLLVICFPISMACFS